MDYTKKADVIETLRDGGCSETEIRTFLCANPIARLRYLRSIRAKRLEQWNEIKREIDCLDFIIYKTENNEVNIEDE